MPLTHVRRFRVRHYECDTRGRLRAANYLRYMQEAAFDASAAAGYDLARYDAMGHFWLIRETEIEYLLPVHYDDEVDVKTWVADFRSVRSQRAYEFRLAGGGPLVAVAHTDWAFLETGTGRPATIPEEMKAAFFPESAPDRAGPRARFPVATDPPAGAYQQRRPVEWRDLDAVGHVNNAVYVDYVEQCGLDWARAQGWPLEPPPVTRSHQLSYRQPALPGDELLLRTWLASDEDGTLVRDTTVHRTADGSLIARARTVSQ